MALTQMYDAKAGSPTTVITGNLTAGTTTIPVQDIAALTAAPGLATLTDGQGNQEIILYTGIAGNDLTGVTRGFEGDARSWPTGTFISRRLTAHDINTLQANVTTLNSGKIDGSTFTNHVQSIASASTLGHVKVGTNLTITGDGTLNAEAGGASSADEVTYSNTTSGLTATDVQAAIDEVDGDLDTHKAEIMPHETADGGYKWGLRINPDLSATFIFEEGE